MPFSKNKFRVGALVFDGDEVALIRRDRPNGTYIEVRVCDEKRRDLKAADESRFTCGSDEVLTRAKRVARYARFEEMLDAEGAERVNPTLSRDQQLAGLRRVYGPEKEALGVLAIEIELVV